MQILRRISKSLDSVPMGTLIGVLIAISLINGLVTFADLLAKPHRQEVFFEQCIAYGLDGQQCDHLLRISED